MKVMNINKYEMFKISAFNKDHTCPLKDKVYSQKQLTSNLIGGIIKPKLVDHKRKHRATDIKNDVKLDLEININYMCAWRAKEKALISFRGTSAGSYNKLSVYLYMMSITYPGSHIQLKKTVNNQFLYVFIALRTFIQGFGHSRLVAVVDENHLRGPYNKTFVAANTTDGVEAYRKRSNMFVVSNRNESIINAVARVYTDVSHYACLWHLWNNVQKKYKNRMKN
ncbi:uncharacterized protein LOC129892788 [Solanum dulcamara]|uniref:uncharacterized protein LOC129892788 n=1 Tax=Solanum dulcamara TaxID=45834 RepID=UPI002485AC05|nr:uncharacterized protein LOC129892788 [Solanum dulcamara]